jgi:hypothetical protein
LIIANASISHFADKAAVLYLLCRLVLGYRHRHYPKKDFVIITDSISKLTADFSEGL